MRRLSGHAGLAANTAYAVVALVIAACGGNALDYEGEPGQIVTARVISSTPAIWVTVDGESTGTFLVDTGSPLTVVDTDLRALEPGFRATDLDAFGLRFSQLQVAAFDVFAGQQGSQLFDGIIGGDILSHFALTIDYRNPRVWLEEQRSETFVGVSELAPAVFAAASVRGGGVFEVPGCELDCNTKEVSATRILLQMSLEGGEPMWFLVDTGATAVVLEPSVLLELGDVAGRPLLEGVTIGTARGNMKAAYSRIATMAPVANAEAASDATAVSVSALVLPDDSLLAGLDDEVGLDVRGLLGGSYLRQFLATIDYSESALILARYRDQDHIDADEFVRVGFTMVSRGSVWEIQDVFPGTDAAAQGLMLGNVVLRIDNVDINGLDSFGIDALLEPFSLGESVPVDLLREGSDVSFEIAVEDLLPAYE